MTMNETLTGWIRYSWGKEKRLFIYIQDLVIYGIDSGHHDECIELLNTLDDTNDMVELIEFEYNDKLADGKEI